MPAFKWRVRLKPLLSDKQLQESPYKIADTLGMSKNTVRKYMEIDEEITPLLSSNVGILARYFGIDEHRVIELVEVSEETEEEIKTPLAAAI